MKTIEEYSLHKYNEVKNDIDNEYNEYLNNIKVLLRQTNYTEEECEEKLILNSVEKCILEYLGGSKKVQEVGTTNQNIFKVIRTFF
jgi:hypothetical protein